MSVAPFVPADLILDPKHVPLFHEWQGSQVQSDQKGMIRNAEEYFRFLQHLKVEDGPTSQPISVTLPDTLRAVRCGHELHPSIHHAVHYCPVCEVRMSLTFLDAIAEALQNAGGPWHKPGSTKPEKPILRECWHMARLDLQELVESLEVSAELEIQWETFNSHQSPVARRLKTATKAVRIAVMEQKYPAMVYKPQQAGNKRKVADIDESPAQQVKKKRVTFASDIDFEPGRDSTMYCRKSKHYKPGIHACEDSQEWLNTSQCGLNHPDFCNLKLFLTYSQADFDSLDDNTLGRTGEYQCLLSGHPDFEAISSYVAADTLKLGMVETLANLVGFSDAITVLFSDDHTVLDFHLSDSADFEDFDDEEEVVDQNRWTCLGDIEYVSGIGGRVSNTVEMAMVSSRSSVNKMRKIFSV